MSARILTGDSLQILKTLEAGSVNTVITSPPYYGLRDYGTGTWEGGDPNCDHKLPEGEHDPKRAGGDAGSSHVMRFNRSTCHKCGAVRIDDQIGLEETPEEYIAKMVEVFREVKRVLRDDGTVWLNIGDSYAGHNSVRNEGRAGFGTIKRDYIANRTSEGLKPKDLIGIPWMLAFALRADGWYLRQDIIWAKGNPMPESVKDRCTKSHEYIFLLSKSPRYYFDYISIKEPRSNTNKGDSKTFRGGTYTNHQSFNNSAEIIRDSHGNRPPESNLRNKRDVWHINTKPFKGAHFATFPEDLVIPCLLAGCPEGGTALDPFAGSGTVGVVCKKNNRNFIGIELNPEYAEMARNRIDNTPEPQITMECVTC